MCKLKKECNVKERNGKDSSDPCSLLYLSEHLAGTKLLYF